MSMARDTPKAFVAVVLALLFSDSRAGYICVSLDETRVHFVLHDQHWLVRNGKTEELHLREQ